MPRRGGGSGGAVVFHPFLDHDRSSEALDFFLHLWAVDSSVEKIVSGHLWLLLLVHGSGLVNGVVDGVEEGGREGRRFAPLLLCLSLSYRHRSLSLFLSHTHST